MNLKICDKNWDDYVCPDYRKECEWNCKQVGVEINWEELAVFCNLQTAKEQVIYILDRL